jgi:hypothetical protein
MKYITAFLLFVLCVIGIGALVLATRDNPEYSSGEPIAMVKDWLSKQQQSALSAPTGIDAAPEISSFINDDPEQAIWTEEYLGHGKWRVSKAIAFTSGSQDMTFEEMIARTKGWNETRLAEYVSDLSPEDQIAFQAQVRTYTSGQPYLDVLEEWYVYEKSGLIEEAMD